MSKDGLVFIRIEDIPPEGKQVHFVLDPERLNSRVAADREGEEEAGVAPPAYLFEAGPVVDLRLSLEGSTVLVQGIATGTYKTVCSRCAEETSKDEQVSFNLVLKPHSDRVPTEAEQEDLNFGIYADEQIECSAIAEEYIVLSLPFSVQCSDSCKGLCPSCGKNLNQESCSCKVEPEGDPRLKVLRELKLVH